MPEPPQIIIPTLLQCTTDSSLLDGTVYIYVYSNICFWHEPPTKLRTLNSPQAILKFPSVSWLNFTCTVDIKDKTPS